MGYFQVLYRTKKGEKTKSFTVPQGNFQRIVKNVSKKSSPDRISDIIYRSSLKQPVNKCVLTELKKETAAMCATKNVSTLRKIDSENLATFKFETLISEVRLNAPLMYSIFNQIVKGSAIGTVMYADTRRWRL